MLPSGMWRRVAPARTDVSEERIAVIIRVERINELGKTIAVRSVQTTARRPHIPEDGVLDIYRFENPKLYKFRTDFYSYRLL
jgi:hypothetical protein